MNEIVYKEGEAVKGVYIVKNGRFEQRKKLVPSSPGFSKQETGFALNTVDKGGILGFEDISVNKRIHSHSLISMSKDSVLEFIPIEELRPRFLKFPHVMRAVKRFGSKKQLSMDHRFQHIENLDLKEFGSKDMLPKNIKEYLDY